MKRFFCFFLLFFSKFLFSDQLEVDKTYINGKLANSLSYYIKKNEGKKVSLRLVVKVGSALEEEHQRGIAHFLEHMVFRGSENFEDYEMIKYLETIGSEFGVDTNAYTSFDRTIYSLEVPSSNIKDIEKALLFLSDLAFRAKLDEDKISLEKSVILDEMRLRASPQARADEKHLQIILDGTIYKDRYPIGTEKVIKGATRDLLKEFYDTWYIPQNMAVIVVGDIDEDATMGFIEKYFSDEKSGGKIPNYASEKGKDGGYSIVNDPEIGLATVEIVSKSLPSYVKSTEEYSNNVTFAVILNILNERFRNEAVKNNSNFISAFIFSQDFLTSVHLDGIAIYCWEDKVLQGLQDVLCEMVKFRQIGIQKDEFERSINKRKNWLIKERKNANIITQGDCVNSCISSFINQVPIYVKKKFYDIEEESLNKLTYEQVSNIVSTLNFKFDNFICLTLPKDAIVKQKQVEKIINQTTNTWYVGNKPDIFDQTPFLRANFEVTPKILQNKKDEDINATEILFENGVKVILRPNETKKEDILIRAFAKNGKANLPLKYYDNFSPAMIYYLYSGISGIEFSNFLKILNERNSWIETFAGATHRGINAITNKSCFEDILILINRIFTCEKMQRDLWNKTIRLEKENARIINVTPDNFFILNAIKFFTSNSNLFGPGNIDNMNFDDMKSIIDLFFSDIKDFTFVIAGDFDLEEAILFVEKYLGSVLSKPTNKISFVDPLKIEFPKNAEEKIVEIGQDDKSFCIIGWELEKIDFLNPKDLFLLNILRPIVKNRLLESLRLNEAKSYGANGYPNFFLYPSLESFNYFVNFSGPVESIHDLKEKTILEMHNLIDNGVFQEELDKAKALILPNINQDLSSNEAVIKMFFEKQFIGSLQKIENEKIFENISTQEVNDFIKRLFSKNKMAKVLWMPKDFQSLDSLHEKMQEVKN